MGPELQRSPWYDQAPEALPQDTKKKKRRRRFHTVLMVLLIVVVFATAGFSVVLHQRLTHAKAQDSARIYPPTPTWNPDSDGYEEDFRRFFDNYYTVDRETYSGSHLQRVNGNGEISLELVSAEGSEEMTPQALYAACVDSVVGIKSYHEDSIGYAWGTGVILSEDGYIVTNEHVIDEATRASVVLADGREYEAVLIGEDVQTDIALLKIGAHGLSPAVFGDSADLEVGDSVVAIGNPLGDTLTGTMTNGIVSAINRDIQMSGRRMTLIQTNAALNEGNSGGPLLNMYGQVVGITNMKMVNRYSDVTVEGIGFAIPSATVKAVTDQLAETGVVEGRPGLGITVGVIPDEAAEHYELPEGLYITAVSEGSDALKKGVKKGDILTHVNGEPVTKTTEVLAIRDRCSVGDTMTLTLWRDGKSFDVEIVLRDINNLY